MQEQLHVLGKENENSFDIFQDLLEDGQDKVSFENLAKWFLKLES